MWGPCLLELEEPSAVRRYSDTIPNTPRSYQSYPRSCSRLVNMKKTVAIIGAGPCGLVALREMLQAGHDAVLLERSAHLGGVFASATAYPNLHLTISNWAMAFSNFPDPSRLRYSAATEYLQYLHAYANFFRA